MALRAAALSYEIRPMPIWLLRRDEPCADRLAAVEQQVRNDIPAPAVGNDNLDAFGSHTCTDTLFGDHASASGRRARVVDITRQVVTGLDPFDNPRVGTLRIAVEDPVDIGQNQQRRGIHHRGDKPRKFVVIGEHQLGNRYRVILVDDRQYVVCQHRLHAVALVEILAAGRKALFGCQDLPADDSPFVEEVVISVDELHLPDRRIELAGRQRVEPPDMPAHQAAARSNGSRRDYYDFDAVAMQRRNLIDQRCNVRSVGHAV